MAFKGGSDVKNIENERRTTRRVDPRKRQVQRTLASKVMNCFRDRHFGTEKVQKKRRRGGPVRSWFRAELSPSLEVWFLLWSRWLLLRFDAELL